MESFSFKAFDIHEYQRQLKVERTSHVWRIVLDLLYENCDSTACLIAQNMAVFWNANICEDIVLLSVSHTDTCLCRSLS